MSTPNTTCILSLCPGRASRSPQTQHRFDEASCPCCSSSCSLWWCALLCSLSTRTWTPIRSIPSKASLTASSSRSKAPWTKSPPTWASAAAVSQRASPSKDHQQPLAISTAPPCRPPQHTATQAVNLAHLFSSMCGQI